MRIRQPKKNQALVLVSADENIDEQLKGVREILEGMQKSGRLPATKIKKLQPHLLPLYLRVLDGCRAKVSLKNIAKTVLPKISEEAAIKRLEKAHKKANELVEKGWKDVRNLRVTARKKAV